MGVQVRASSFGCTAASASDGFEGFHRVSLTCYGVHVRGLEFMVNVRGQGSSGFGFRILSLGIGVPSLGMGGLGFGV